MRVFTCIVNAHRCVFDSVYMCACVCMLFLVVACKDAGMYGVFACVSMCVGVCVGAHKSYSGFYLTLKAE